jgi:hypothetical protein
VSITTIVLTAVVTCREREKKHAGDWGKEIQNKRKKRKRERTAFAVCSSTTEMRKT